MRRDEEKKRGREEEKKRRREIFRLIRFGFFICSVLFIIACQPNQQILDSQNKTDAGNSSANANPSPAPPVNAFESDLGSMKTANFDFIYVFRRRDGGKLTAEDKKFAKTNSPFETNRFIVSDEERAIIAGSNTRFAAVNLEALKSGFEVTDFSKPESELKNTNANVNANINANANKNGSNR